MPDPKLQEAMAEIRAVIQKHDIGGHVVLVSNTHAQYLYELSPSWSAITLSDSGELRIRANRRDFKTAEDHQRVIEGSAHILAGIRDTTAIAAQNMEASMDVLKRQVTIEEAEPVHEPHREN